MKRLGIWLIIANEVRGMITVALILPHIDWAHPLAILHF